jgi:hypothetical protein
MSKRSIRVGLTASLGLFALPLVAAMVTGACGEEDSTGSRRVALATQITAVDAATAPFTNAYGWSIQLTRAAVSVGALYYFDGATIFSSAEASGPRGAKPGLGRWLGLAVEEAWAHPGHYRPGTAMGQVLDSSSADLLSGVTMLPAGDGVAGIYRSGRFTFEPAPTGPAAAALDGHVVVLEGEATKGEEVRVFRAVADAGDVLDASGEPKLEGCAFEGEPDVQEDGTVTVRVDLRVWLDQADFSSVPASADGAPVTLPEDSEAQRAFTRGLKKGSAVVFGYSPG